MRGLHELAPERGSSGKIRPRELVPNSLHVLCAFSGLECVGARSSCAGVHAFACARVHTVREI